jgi:hypothetical protein
VIGCEEASVAWATIVDLDGVGDVELRFCHRHEIDYAHGGGR